MTDIIFSFDTEDYVHKESADAVIRCTQLLNKHGVVGCFNVVARLAMALEQWERQDAIEELNNNIISREELREYLNPIYDLERLMSKISYKSANPRDLIAFKNSIDFISYFFLSTLLSIFFTHFP